MYNMCNVIGVVDYVLMNLLSIYDCANCLDFLGAEWLRFNQFPVRYFQIQLKYLIKSRIVKCESRLCLRTTVGFMK